ncbi:MAG: folylpolyglutamate synthase/dihydrofolate synthase family protein [Bryobacteraceae bacterium]|nr:folylpolyglutamate synthase/dihydrofolate synthase family protein [Bryobacteraceae bacterium]
MPYPESVQFLYALGNEIKTVKFGLEAISALVEELGHPERRYGVIHVAGTNGKGSTCAMIEAAARKAGYRTGLYTSPHLVEPTERIRINGKPVTREAFAKAFDVVHAANERLLAAGRIETHTTYFETVTAMGFLLMAQATVDLAIVEVGLGGRLDATNVVNPRLCVITSIDFDHEAWLGNSLEKIAAEKAGILKAGVPAVFSPQRPEALAVLEARATELGITPTQTAPAKAEVHATGCDFEAFGRTIHCPLAGAHQAINALTAVTALHQLGIAPDVSETQWPGRLQIIHGKPLILLDGAHNPAGVRALAAHLERFYADRPITLIYGAMRDKSVQEITEILFPLADTVILTAPDSPRAVRPEALAAESDHPNILVLETAREALEHARNARPDDLVIITGSLYLVGEILALIQ